MPKKYERDFKELLQKYVGDQQIKFDKEIQFTDFSIIVCTQYDQFGDESDFELIAKNGRYYNSNFDDWEELRKERL